MRCVLTDNYMDKRCGVAGWVAVRRCRLAFTTLKRGERATRWLRSVLADPYPDKRCRVAGLVAVCLFRACIHTSR